jgi:hypothetical protein
MSTTPTTKTLPTSLCSQVHALELRLQHLLQANKELAKTNERLLDEVQKLSLDLGLREAGK